MGFDRPTRTIDYVDLKAETASGPRRIAFRVLQFLPMELGDFVDRNTGEKSKVWPVLADAKLLDGPNAGSVYRGKVYKFGITSALRDAGPNEPTPKTVPGAELMVIAARPTGKGVSKESVFGNRPTDEEMEEMITEFERLGGWDQSISPDELAAGTAPARQPAMAGAPAAAAPAAATAPAAPVQATGSAPRRPFGRSKTTE
jgi:hypothetical protein